MQFARLDNAFSVCKAHLGAGSVDPEIESYLVGYLIVIVSAEFESAIEAMVNQRGARAGDAHISNFIQAAAAKTIRSVKVEELTGVLGQFHLDCKNKFIADPVKVAAQASYGNIVINRHNIAHATGATMTFAELEKSFVESKQILECFGLCLGLSQNELDGLTW